MECQKNMIIKQIITNGTTVYIFTENPEEDIIKFREKYSNDDSISNLGFPLGYEEPELTEYTFLGNKYKCIGLWFDNEDIPDVLLNFKH